MRYVGGVYNRTELSDTRHLAHMTVRQTARTSRVSRIRKAVKLRDPTIKQTLVVPYDTQGGSLVTAVHTAPLAEVLNF